MRTLEQSRYSRKELERLASEDEAKAEEGLVEMKNPQGEVYYKHIDALTPEDRLDRGAGEGAGGMDS